MNQDEIRHQNQSVLFFKKEPHVEEIMYWFSRHSFRMEDLDYANARRHETALHAACRQGNLRIVKWLIKEGASLNMQDENGNT